MDTTATPTATLVPAPEATPVTPPSPAASLRALAVNFLAILDAADEPLAAKLGDPVVRTAICRKLAGVPAYRDDVMEAIGDKLRWEDVAECRRIVDGAANDTDVIEAVLENADWSDIESQFSDEIRDAAKDGVGEMDTYDLVKAHGADSLAENDAVREAVLETLTKAERAEIFGTLTPDELASAIADTTEEK